MNIPTNLPQKIYKQELAGKIITGFLFLGLIGLWIAACLQKESMDTRVKIFLALLVLFFGYVFLDYITRRIITDDSYITYRTILRTSAISYGEITKIETVARLQSHGNGVSGKYNLILHSYDRKLVIPIKAYSRKSLKEIASTLVEKCRTADIDQQTKWMTEGKMPSVFFKHA